MSRVSDIVAGLQGFRHGGSSTEADSSGIWPSSPDSQVADHGDPSSEDAAIKEEDKENITPSPGPATPVIKVEADDEGTISPLSLSNEPEPVTPVEEKFTYLYKIDSPQPTIALPANYQFRTNEAGYPIFQHRASGRRHRHRRRGRASMADAPGFQDPRITAFITHWTNFYKSMVGRTPRARAQGMSQLRLACMHRRLAKYGSKDMLVTRLVDRALRDAVRGWSEIYDLVGRITLQEPPEAPALLEEVDFDGDADDESSW